MDSNPSKNSQISENLSEKLMKIEDSSNELQNKKPLEDDQVMKASDDVLTLTEDVFGQYRDEKGDNHYIKRFIWKNQNKIEVQVMNYGARIISIKLPDRKGDIEDIVLGFDDLPGYIYYKNFYFGATIGRTSHLIRNSKFILNKKEYYLTCNHIGRHHLHGGKRGLDQVVWNTHVEDKKVIMTHVSPHMEEGYPGDLFIRIRFELSISNEFKVNMDAWCTEPTIVNLSNLTYFNLAGHHAGPDEIYKHILTLNCNCFTPQKDRLTTGEVLNVLNSEFDFQIPKVLGKVIGIVPKDGFNHNFCVNRGMNQEECFVGRVLHPPSGRMLEIYCNQQGVNFSTANEFGYGRVLSMHEISPVIQVKDSSQDDNTLKILNKIHDRMLMNLKVDEMNNFKELKNFIMKFRNLEYKSKTNITPSNSPKPSVEIPQNVNIDDFIFTPMQISYLKNIQQVIEMGEFEEECEWLKSAVEKILKFAIIRTESSQQHPEETRRSSENLQYSTPKKQPIEQNIIPSYYKNTNQIVGKERKVYKMHGGISLQTQNYPGCESFKNFPNCVLNPGENYTHNITYKFWIRAGNPNKWIRRNINEGSPMSQKMG